MNDETTVRKISFKFVDTQTFEESKLREQIATQGPGFWDTVRRILPFASAGVYPFSPIELQKDVKRLERYYRRNGFLHPRIDYPASQLDTAKNRIHIVFTVREGPPLIIQDVGFFTTDSTYVYQEFDEGLRRAWIDFRDATTVEVGSRYTEFDRLRIQSDVETWLKDAGFAFADVESRVTIDSVANTADLHFRVAPGPRAYVEDILVEGNETVSDEVVLRELPFKVGDRFSHRRMVRGQRELFSLNLFRVALADVPEQPVDSSVVVRYRVSEAQLRYVSAQTGYAADDGATLQAEWRHRNFMGGARQLTVSGLVQSGYGASLPSGFQSSQLLNATVSLRQPYLGSTRLSGILSPFFTWQDVPTQRFSVYEWGLTSTLLFEIYPFRTATLQHTFSRAYGDTRGLLSRMPDAALDPTDIYDRNIFSLSATLGKVDDFLSPEKGFLVRPFAEAAVRIFGDTEGAVEYHKLSNEVSGYLPLAPRTSVASRVFVGRIWPRGASRRQDDPRIENRFDRVHFYAGGANDVRGWPTDLLGEPRIDTVYVDGEISWADSVAQIPDVSFEPEGGLAKLAFNLELRLPFPGLGDAWRTAVFLDGGQVSRDPFDLKGLKFGAGAGFRYQTPVGYIRLDFARKLNPTATDLFSADENWRHRYRGEPLPRASWKDYFRIHLSIGQAF